MSQLPARRPIRRGASDLRSAAAARGAQLPHKTYMRLVCLEMERHRRSRERDHLLARAQRCGERCDEIDAEVRELVAALDLQRPAAAGKVIAEAKPRVTRTRQRAAEPGATVIHCY